MKSLIAFLLLAGAAAAQMRVVALPGKSPLVTLRIVFRTGSAEDPPDKPGLANLTAAMMAEGGTKDMTYKQILDALFPMAASIRAQVDKEMTTFSGVTHVDNLAEYYKLFRGILLEPGWREDDFKRVRDDAINFLRVSLRDNNDEELGKEVLYNVLYEGTPYGHHNAGTVSALEKMTLDDLKGFYRRHYHQQDLVIGIAGGYSREFLHELENDLRKLPRAGTFAVRLPKPKPVEHNRARIVEKDTRSVAYSIGYPIDFKRGDPDYPALLLAVTYLGHHRSSGGRLYNRMRELRGLNYGDYAYIEYFPRGMFLMEPSPNLARSQQIFQIWIRPVEPPTATFSLRLATYELNKFVRDGLSQEDFQRTREFLSKYVNLLMKTKSAELGYAIDSAVYRTPEYARYIRGALAKLTREAVNGAIRRRLRADRLQIVAITKNAEELKQQWTGGAVSPMTYNSPKPQDVVEEDKVVASWDLGLRPEDIKIVPVSRVFE